MNCANHSEIAATAYCRTCGKALCAACARNIHGVIYCEECLAARVEGAPPAAATGQREAFDHWVAQNTGAHWVAAGSGQGPNPAVAGILSGFLPLGTGAMYCGEFTRALFHAGMFFGLIAMASTVHGPADAIFGLGIGFWYIFMIIDSVRVAKAKQRGEPVPDLLGIGIGHPSEPAATLRVGYFEGAAASGSATGAAPTTVPGAPPVTAGHRHLPIGPLLLIGLGILFMLNVSDVWAFSWDRTWPLIVIGVGVWMLFSRVGGWSMGYGHGRGWSVRAGYANPARLTAPALVIVTGVLGLLYEYTSWGWDRTWPLYLIVIGVLQMLRFTGLGQQNMEPPAPPQPPASATSASGSDTEAESQVTNG